jgi:predicted O-methyltransferase YrrM
LETWPGEHYKLLKSICQVLKPDLVVEIGTFEGPSALSMLEGMNKSSRLVTFDIVPWKCIPTTWLKTTDFDNGRLAQIVGDLSKPEVFRMHQALFESADLIFIDGPKDIVFETQLLDRLETISLKKDTLVVVDDIRKWNMLKIWKYLARPKLDFTSFGHWSGTGLIDWNG